MRAPRERASSIVRPTSISRIRPTCSCTAASISATRRPTPTTGPRSSTCTSRTAAPSPAPSCARSPYRFRTLGGKVERIDRRPRSSTAGRSTTSRSRPSPSLVFLPFVAIFGLAVNDVLLTVAPRRAGADAALLRAAPPRRARRLHALRRRRPVAHGMFGFGTVYFYSSVIGQVWYTAHVVATVLTGLFVLASFEARRPIVAGFCVGALLVTRPHIAAWALFFFYEAWRAHGRSIPLAHARRLRHPRRAPRRRRLRLQLGALRRLRRVRPLLPQRPLDRSHPALRPHQLRLPRAQPDLRASRSRRSCIGKPPYLQLPWHGMSLLITTPAYLYLLWPRVKTPLHTALWCVVAPIALAGFLYQNDGWVQFGYRFSNDFSFALIMLLAIGGRPLTRTLEGAHPRRYRRQPVRRASPSAGSGSSISTVSSRFRQTNCNSVRSLRAVEAGHGRRRRQDAAEAPRRRSDGRRRRGADLRLARRARRRASTSTSRSSSSRRASSSTRYTAGPPLMPPAVASLAARLPDGARLVPILPAPDLEWMTALLADARIAGRARRRRPRPPARSPPPSPSCSARDLFGVEKVLPWGVRVYSALVSDYHEKSARHRRHRRLRRRRWACAASTASRSISASTRC